jgi:hypothetical protein
MQEGEPMYVLRDRLMQNSQAKAKLQSSYIAALYIKAWNYTRGGKKLSSLRYRQAGDKCEDFPVVR